MEPGSQAENEPYVFTTVRWDPALLQSPENTAASCSIPCPFYMLEHHWTRLQMAKWNSSLLRSSPAELLRDLTDAVQQWRADHPDEKPDSLRVKHRVYSGGRTLTEISAIPCIPLTRLFPRHLEYPDVDPDTIVWKVCLDRQAIVTSAATMYKTGDRRYYDRARASAGIDTYAEQREVLLFNEDEEVIDASFSTPYFFREGIWVTPKANSGGQQGTTRRWALERKLCVEGDVTIQELRQGEVIYLSNAVRGYVRARYVTESKPLS
ncbi:Aminodeoxychorismate lyase [Elasticomyces elasticus]|nr:Aminodeoxychorismate lyase [Elasticomyces elasticus]